MPDPEPLHSQLASASVKRPAKLQKLLVATAFMEPSATLEQALHLAKLAAKRVVLLHVVEISRSELNPAVFASLEAIQSRLDAYQQMAHQRLETLGKAFWEGGVECTTSVRVGIPHEEILKEAEAIAPDLIIVGAKATPALGRFLLGGAAELVVRHAPCPVLVIRQRHRQSSP